MNWTWMCGAAALIIAAGCEPTPEPETAEPQPGTAEYNQADVAFMQGMIPHHREAIAMAELVPERTNRPELIGLAREIIASQQAEIEEMHRMLREAGFDPAHMDMPQEMPGHDMVHDEVPHGDMPHDEAAHMTPEEMQALEAASGQEFDILFAELMIHHHEGAIVSAEQVQQEGQNERVAEMAREIIAEQQAEIQQLRRWLDEWGG